MNVLLNTQSLRPPLTGIGRYTLELLRGLHASAEVDSLACFSDRLWSEERIKAWVEAGTPPEADGPAPGRSRLRRVVRRIPGSYRAWNWWRERRLRGSLRGRRDAVYHEPNYILRPVSGRRVATVHDLSHEHFPEFHPRERVSWLKRGLRETMREADRVITVSGFVRDELSEMFPEAAERIIAIHNGVSPDYRPRGEDETREVLGRHGLRHGAYIFTAATFEPRKNLERSLKAYLSLPPELKREYPLVLAGAPGWHAGALEREVAAGMRLGQVKSLGYLPERELTHLYSGAALFVFASIYEGFGLPVAEALASGVATVTSNRSSMPEVAGGAARLVDPFDGLALAVAMQDLLEDDDGRAALAASARERGRAFSWERCVAETLQVYRSVL